MSTPTYAYRTAHASGETTLHVDEDCHYLHKPDRVIEVRVANYKSNWTWCPYCSGGVDGVQAASVNKTKKPNLSRRLRHADSLDDLRGGE